MPKSGSFRVSFGVPLRLHVVVYRPSTLMAVYLLETCKRRWSMLASIIWTLIMWASVEIERYVTGHSYHIHHRREGAANVLVH